ncbi:MAG: hypothetical protein ACFFA0_09260 [Promethearchaeota archaeon]
MDKIVSKNMYRPGSKINVLFDKDIKSWNFPLIPKWEPYGKNRATMMFGKEIRLVNDPYRKERVIWDDVLTFKG